ncbi:MAG TPA: hypothetical protein TECP_00128 [Hyphomicrobiaceae bacterium MAG_BT-2024]
MNIREQDRLNHCLATRVFRPLKPQAVLIYSNYAILNFRIPNRADLLLLCHT